MDTSFFSHLNWLAVAVAAVAYFLLGAIWYSKALFAKQWMKGTGIDMNKPDAGKGVGGVMVFTLVLEFIVCIGLAILVYRLNLTTLVSSGIKLGILTGVSFCGIGIAISYLYQRKPGMLTLIDAGYHVAGNIIAAIILCMWP
jgi:Protein of unknown function (DUF1761)